MKKVEEPPAIITGHSLLPLSLSPSYSFSLLRCRKDTNASHRVRGASTAWYCIAMAPGSRSAASLFFSSLSLPPPAPPQTPLFRIQSWLQSNMKFLLFHSSYVPFIFLFYVLFSVLFYSSLSKVQFAEVLIG
jgi:hypothetical protein